MFRALLIAVVCSPVLAGAQSFPTKFPAAGYPAPTAQKSQPPPLKLLPGARATRSAESEPEAKPVVAESMTQVPPRAASNQSRLGESQPLSPAEITTLPVSGANRHLRQPLKSPYRRMSDRVRPPSSGADAAEK